MAKIFDAINIFFVFVCGEHIGGVYCKSANHEVKVLKAIIEDECFKKGVQVEGIHNEIEDVISHLNKQKAWNGRRVFYKIANFPKCSEMSFEDVRTQIDEAANTWNQIEGANVLLVNIDENNEVEENINQKEEWNNEIEELSELTSLNSNTAVTADILVSFEKCIHLKHRDRKPNAHEEDFGEDCHQVYAHAHFYGDIHFNDHMTWTDRNYNNEELLDSGNFLKPNLYSIALHEFGHSLGLRHTAIPEDVMYWDFSGRRVYDRLEISQNDITALQNAYPVKEKCKDSAGVCSTSPDKYCNNPNTRPYCVKTCGDCDLCGTGLVDDYIKCSKDICKDTQHKLRQFCRKTCDICGEETEPEDIEDCKDTTDRDCKSLRGREKRREKKCKKQNWKDACPLTCGVCEPSEKIAPPRNIVP